MLAVIQNRVLVVELLLDAGANIEAFDDFNMRPLLYAALLCHNPLATLLQSRGAKPRGRDCLGERTALELACASGNMDLIRSFVEHGMDLFEERYGPGPIVHACVTDRLEVLQFAFSIRRTDTRPLKYRRRLNTCIVNTCISHGAVDILDWLRVERAITTELNDLRFYVTFSGYTSIQACCYSGSGALLEWLFSKVGVSTTLLTFVDTVEHPAFLAIRSGNIHCLSILQAHCDIDTGILTLDDSLQTLLMETIVSQYLDPESRVKLARQWIDLGCDIHAVNARQETALMLAAKVGDLEIIKMLIEAGADASITLVNENGASSVCMAAHSKFPSIVEWLLTHALGPIPKPSTKDDMPYGSLADSPLALIPKKTILNLFDECAVSGLLDRLQHLASIFPDFFVEKSQSLLKASLEFGKKEIAEWICSADTLPLGRQTWSKAILASAMFGSVELYDWCWDQALMMGGVKSIPSHDQNDPKSRPNSLVIDALGVACIQEKIDLVKELLRRHSFRKMSLKIFETEPLIWACSAGNREIILLLLEHGAYIVEDGAYARGVPLRAAVDSGDFNFVHSVLKHMKLHLPREDFLDALEAKSISEPKILEKHTALSWATCRGFGRIFKLLVEEGAQVTSSFGLAHLAVETADLEILEYLLKHEGKKPFQREVNGLYPLNIAVELGYVNSINLILDNTSEMMLSEYWRLKKLEGQDYNFVIRSRLQFLNHVMRSASSVPFPELIRAIYFHLKQGVAEEAQAMVTRSLIAAGQTQVLGILITLELVIPINKPDNDGYLAPPEETAVAGNHLDELKVIRAHGGLNPKNRSGIKLLSSINAERSLSAVKWLLSKGHSPYLHLEDGSSGDIPWVTSLYDKGHL